MKYDETTGLYYEDDTPAQNKVFDSAESQKDANEQKSNVPNDKVDADDVVDEKDINPLNKKLIFIVIGILIFAAVVFAVINPSGIKKNKSKAEIQLASDIRVPAFNDTNDTNFETKIMPAPDTMEKKEFNSIINASSKPTTYSTPKPPQQIASKAVLTEADLEAYKAPIGSEVTDLSKKGSNKTQSISPSSNYFDYPSGISGGSQADYINNSLSSLGLTSNNDSYTNQNMQSNKQNFNSSGKDNMIYGYYIGEETIWEGTVLHVLLDTAICTDLPGQIKAHFTENVYDSLTGTKLLIPQGTILLAEYNSSVSYSQKRVQIAWKTLIRPDGYKLDLGNMTGIDSTGAAGVKGRIDEHLFEYVKAMGIISMFTAINGEFSSSLNLTNNETAQNLMTANQAAVNQLGNKMIDRALDIQPTILIKGGTSVMVFVNKDISLPPMNSPEVTQKYVR